MVCYYDMVLGGIAALLGVGMIASTVTVPLALTLFACGALVLVGHALFIRPPIVGQSGKTPATVAGQAEEQ